jgi:hypothetical protein
MNLDTKPHIPKEVRAMIYKFLALDSPPRTISLELHVYPRLPDGESQEEEGFYLTSSSRPPTEFNVETWSRVCALKMYNELHPKTNYQHWPIYFRPEKDTVSIPFSMLNAVDLGFWAGYNSPVQELKNSGTYTSRCSTRLRI